MMCWSFYKDVDDFVASVHSWKYSEWHSPFILSPQQLRPHPSPWAISTANSPALSSLFPPIAFVFGSVQDFTHSAYTHTHTLFSRSLALILFTYRGSFHCLLRAMPSSGNLLVTYCSTSWSHQLIGLFHLQFI